MKYYITNLYVGVVECTNDDEVAKSCSQCEEFFVVNTENGMWLSEGEYFEIKEISE